MNKDKFVIGAVFGAVAGVVAGVLSAPKSGKETREEIKIKAAELREEAARRTEEAKNTDKPVESLKDQAGHALGRSKEAIKSLSDKK